MDTLDRQTSPRQANGVDESTEGIDAIIRLETLLKLEKHRGDEIAKEKKMLEQQVKSLEKEIHRLNTEAAEIRSATGWTKGYNAKTPLKDVSSMTNRILELEMEILKYQEEERMRRKEDRKKEKSMTDMARQLLERKLAEEDVKQSQNTIKLKDQEIKALTEELKNIKRMQTKKDQTIESLESKKDDGPIKTLENDKRFLQSEIMKHVETRKRLERTIKSQQGRLDSLESKLSCINNALKDLQLEKQIQQIALGHPTGTRTSPYTDYTETTARLSDFGDSELSQLLQRDIEHLRDALSLKDVIIQEKDQNLEALDKKVEILLHAKRSESRAGCSERKELTAQIDSLQKALDEEQESRHSEADNFRREIGRLKSRLRDLSHPPLSTVS